jgi:hypothetical protein
MTMKTLFAFLLMAPLGCFTVTSICAQNYSIPWFTIGGGGGKSTGGVFVARGTIGQPDADKLSGGNYTVDAGFWSVIAVVPTTGAPALTLTLTPTNTAKISWPSPSTGFSLQQNGSLSTANWVAPAESVTDDGTNTFIVVKPPLSNRFYRLVKPPN